MNSLVANTEDSYGLRRGGAIAHRHRILLAHSLAWLTVSSCFVFNVDSAVTAPRTIEATWAERAPLIDGRLDEPCWSQAKAVTGFTLMHSERASPFQTYAYITHDEENLYIGMKCLQPEGAKPRGKIRSRDDYLFADDIVEILIDPGATRESYYQFVVNAYGSMWETVRTAGGAQHDQRWAADWQAAASVDDEYWSMEAAIPFHNFGALAELNRSWAINLCREAQVPSAHSSIAPGGSFHDANLFPELKGLRTDFSRYSIVVSDVYSTGAPEQEEIVAALRVSLTNIGKVPRTVDVKQFAAGDQATESHTLMLARGARQNFNSIGWSLSPFFPVEAMFT